MAKILKFINFFFENGRIGNQHFAATFLRRPKLYIKRCLSTDYASVRDRIFKTNIFKTKIFNMKKNLKRQIFHKKCVKKYKKKVLKNSQNIALKIFSVKKYKKYCVKNISDKKYHPKISKNVLRF